MNLVAQFADAGVIAVVGLLLAFYLRGRFDDLKREMDRRSEQNDRQHERLASDIAGARTDITQIALALGTFRRPEANEG